MNHITDNMPNVVWIWDVSSLYSRESTFCELTEDNCPNLSPMVVLIHKEGKFYLLMNGHNSQCNLLMCYVAVSDLTWEINEKPEDNNELTPAMNSTIDEEKKRYRVAIATGSNSLYLWCDLGASAINLSTDSSGT